METGKRTVVWAMVLTTTLVAACRARGDEPPRESRRYAIVVEEKTLADPAWNEVVQSLRQKHSAKLFQWEPGGAEGLRTRLGAWRPRYVCFVARPEELARQTIVRVRDHKGKEHSLPMCGAYYHDIGTLMRSLDADTYDDALWGVLTGAGAEDAARVVSAKPLSVCRGLSHVGAGWLEWLDSGVSFSEVEKGKRWTKEPGGLPVESKGPDDAAEEFVRELNSNQVDMVSSSGHATEHDWQMGFTYKSGRIIPTADVSKEPEAVRANYEKVKKAIAQRGSGAAAGLLGVSASGEVYPLLTDNPKVYYSPGNCLIARVDGQDCMALSWIRHGATQFFGHVGVQTRSCYAWGVAEYFLSLQGRFSFAEAVWLNQQALWWELSQGKQDAKQYVCCRNQAQAAVDGRLLWETTVLYGDPAWEARVQPVVPPLYDQEIQTKTLPDGREELTFLVKIRRKSLPTRPAAFLLKTQARTLVEVKEGPKSLVVGETFALVPFWKAGEPTREPGKEYKAVAIVRTEPSDANPTEK